MLYQALCTAALFALLLAYRQSGRLQEGRWAFFSLYLCAVGYGLTGAYAGDAPYATVVQSIEALCFAMLLPLYFCATKQFTNLSLPQWRALRAFALGVPLLVGINAAVAVLEQPALGQPGLAPYVTVAYCFGVLSACVCLWRFTTTPRQRLPMLSLMLAPLALVTADIGSRLWNWTLWDVSPAVWVTFGCQLILSLFARNLRSFSIRPVARSAVIDQVRDGLVVVDANLRIVDYNQAAAEMLEAVGHTLIGRSAKRCLPEPLSELLGQQGAQNLVLPWQVADAQSWVEVHIHALIVNKRANGQLLTLRDVSRRHRAELELRESRLQLQVMNERLEALANTDALTGLFNRRAFLHRLNSEVERHSRSGMTLGLLMLDLDHFKAVNDEYGHPTGDRVLAATAACMEETVREGDSVGRLGGEEFAILVVDATANGPMVLAERVLEKLRALQVLDDTGETIPVTASIGCVQFSGGMVNGDTLLQLADQALYAAKREGRDQVRLADYQPLPGPDYGAKQRSIESVHLAKV